MLMLNKVTKVVEQMRWWGREGGGENVCSQGRKKIVLFVYFFKSRDCLYLGLENPFDFLRVMDLIVILKLHCIAYDKLLP